MQDKTNKEGVGKRQKKYESMLTVVAPLAVLRVCVCLAGVWRTYSAFSPPMVRSLITSLSEPLTGVSNTEFLIAQRFE